MAINIPAGISSFQSTHLIRGVTLMLTGYNASPVFQSTHLIRGVTSLTATNVDLNNLFQSTHLIRGVTRY